MPASGGGPDAPHRPVLLREAVQHLALERGGLFVDATLGLGGHTRDGATVGDVRRQRALVHIDVVEHLASNLRRFDRCAAGHAIRRIIAVPADGTQLCRRDLTMSLAAIDVQRHEHAVGRRQELPPAVALGVDSLLGAAAPSAEASPGSGPCSGWLRL